MESCVRIEGEGFEKSYIPLHGGREGVKNCQNHPYVNNEWPLIEREREREREKARKNCFYDKFSNMQFF